MTLRDSWFCTKINLKNERTAPFIRYKFSKHTQTHCGGDMNESYTHSCSFNIGIYYKNHEVAIIIEIYILHAHPLISIVCYYTQCHIIRTTLYACIFSLV